MLSNLTGRGFDYDGFKNKIDTDPDFGNAIDKLIQTHDENGFTLKTNNTAVKQPSSDEQSDAMIQSSAKRAAAKMLNKK